MEIFPRSELLERALERFPDMSDAECAAVARVSQGLPADFEGFTAVRQARGKVRLRAEILNWLCMDRKARDLISDVGIVIAAACIEGPIHLMFAAFDRPLLLVDCDIKGEILLSHAGLKTLSLEGSRVGENRVGEKGKTPMAIVADGAKISGDVLLRKDRKENGKPFQAFGEVRLFGVTIGGDLDCAGGEFRNEGGDALSADLAKIGGSVNLREGFQAFGEVRLLGATIGGNLDGVGGEFRNEGCDDQGNPRKALSADGAKIAGDVRLREGFRAFGEVRLLGATIGGDLDCVGGEFRNEGRDALSADGAKIAGEVGLREGFQAFGAVRLRGATIGGNLSCTGGEFRNEGGYALNAGGIEITGSVFLREGCLFEGIISLVEAEIGRHLQWRGVKEQERATLDLRGAHAHTLWIGKKDFPGPNRLYLHGLTYDSIDDEMETSAAWWIEFIETQAAESPGSQAARDAEKILLALGEKSAAQRRRALAEKLNLFLPQPYEQAAKVLRAQGHEADAREVLIAKERRRKAALPSPLATFRTAFKSIDDFRRALSTLTEWAWYRTLAPLIGYGHRPSPALWLAVLSVFLGWGGFAWADAKGVMKPEKAERQAEFRPLVYALETFTPLIKLREADYWRADTGRRLGRWVDTLTVVYTCWGWILTTLLVAALTGLVRR